MTKSGGQYPRSKFWGGGACPRSPVIYAHGRVTCSKFYTYLSEIEQSVAKLLGIFDLWPLTLRAKRDSSEQICVFLGYSLITIRILKAVVLMRRLVDRRAAAGADAIHRSSRLPGWCPVPTLSRTVVQLPHPLVPRRSAVHCWSQVGWTAAEPSRPRPSRRHRIHRPSGTTNSAALWKLDLRD